MRSGRPRPASARDHHEPLDGMLRLNGQLADKVQELFVLSDDLASLIESSDIATVFLDTQLRIKRFTTTAARPFNLQPSDVGGPIGQIRPNLDGIDLERDCQAGASTCCACFRIAAPIAASPGESSSRCSM